MPNFAYANLMLLKCIVEFSFMTEGYKQLYISMCVFFYNNRILHCEMIEDNLSVVRCGFVKKKTHNFLYYVIRLIL